VHGIRSSTSAVPVPRTTSMASACSVLISSISLTLQKPDGRIGTPFSRTQERATEPAPVNDGRADRGRDFPRRCRAGISAPGTRFRTSELCVAPEQVRSRRRHAADAERRGERETRFTRTP
jgi:hypothetical protein